MDKAHNGHQHGRCMLSWLFLLTWEHVQSNSTQPQVESNTVADSRARLMEELNKSEEDRWRERAENAARARKQRSGVRPFLRWAQILMRIKSTLAEHIHLVQHHAGS